MADIVGFGSKGLGGKKAVASIDVDKMAESMGVSEEIVSQNVLAIEAIWATEGKGKGWKTRQTQYILGIKPRPAAKLTKEEKAAKKRADQAAERQKLLDMGVNVSVVPRGDRKSDDERDDIRRAAARARGKLRRRNQQVGPALLPRFYTKYFDVDVDRRGKKTTDEVKALINDAKDTGLWVEMKQAIASESLLSLDPADMNKVISDVKKRRQG